MISSIPQVFAAWARVLKPRPKRNIWQWADESRFLAKGVSAKSRHGNARFTSADAPHQREMMESPLDPTVQTTVVIGASQIMGKTESCVNNLIGFHMDYRPTNIIVMYPTIEAAEKYSKKKFMPMCRATPCLDSLLANSRSRDSGNTILVKEYTGGSVFFVGANSPASLRSSSGEILIADEIDSNPDEAGEEGDSVELLFKRGESYPQVVQVLLSTPTIEGSSRIWTWFESSDQRFWFVPCRSCGVLGIFKWSPESAIKAGPAFFMDYPKGNPDAAVIVCASCAASMNDKQRLDAYYAGRWQSTTQFNGIRGFHMNWMYAWMPAKKGFRDRIHQMAVEWERAKKKGPTAMKVIVNTGFSETWKVKLEDAPDWKVLLERRESYVTPIPEGVVYLTLAEDTQSDRLEYEICGWGIGEECWGIKTGKIFGSPFRPETWQRFEDDVLNQTFPHPCGATLRISCALLDSGGQSDEKAFAKPVYAFVMRRQGRHIYACKGSSTLGAPLVIGHLQKNRILLQNIGTDVAKSMIYERAGILTPGPGFYHWSADEKAGYGEEYFQQFTAESIQLLKGKRVWVKTRARNEALDLRVYNHAAFEIRNVNLEAVARSIQPKEVPKPVPITEIPGLVIKPAVPVPPPKPVTRFRRRIGFQGW